MAATRETFSEIVDHILDQLGVADNTDQRGPYTTPKICRALNHVQNRLAIKLTKVGDEFIGTSASCNSVVGQETYSIGPSGDFDVDDFLKLKQVIIIDENGYEQDLDIIQIKDRHKYVLPSSSQSSTLNSPAAAYFLTKTPATSTVRLPCIGLIPPPTTAGTNNLRIYYFFKPTPISYNGTELSNGSRECDLPETLIPVLKTLTVDMLFEIEKSIEHKAMLSPRLHDETSEAMDSVVTQQEGTVQLMDWREDPAVDY